MIEQIWENRDITVENVLQEGKQNLSDLKKEVNISDNQKNIDFSEKIPPKLKDIYKKLLKINSKKDVKNIQLDWRELEYVINLFQKYSGTKLGKQVVDNFKDIFGAQGNLSIYQENFAWMKLLTINIGQQELFAINYTVPSIIYSCWKMWDTPIVVDRSPDRCYVRDAEGNKLEWRFSVMPDGNLLPVSENGEYNENTFLFWDLSFNKWANNDFAIAPTKSPNAMLTYVYEKKKQKLSFILPNIPSLENMWYIFQRDERTMSVAISKNGIVSKKSESILSYKTDKDFIQWLEGAKGSIDSGVIEVENKEAAFKEFYKKYFNSDWTYAENTRYEIVEEWGTSFYLIDKQNRDKKLTETTISVFDERWRVLKGIDIDGMIEKYEAQEIYLKFIAKNNTKDVMNSQWVHAVNSYYLWYGFEYKNHMIALESSPVTDWKYAITVHEKETKNFKWRILLDNYISVTDIEKQIDKLLK